MSLINIAYINALLADAAYVPVENGSPSQAKLKERLTETQANYLAANFEVISSVETPQTLGSGFDAVVWQIKAGSELAGTNNENAGKVFVSTRGTQGLQDISDDVSLALRGIPHQQIADMVNWWLIETATVGSVVKQIRVQETGNLLSIYELVAASPVTATRTGALVGVTNIAAVNGHSLGGYLATAFTRLFGSQAGVQSVNTFNSAGFANASAFNTDTEFNKVATLLGLTGSFAAVGAIQTNYFAQNGISFTTNSLADMRLPGFGQYGRRVGLEQEEATGLPNHSMYKLTDLLALGTALEKLDPSLTIDKLNALAKAGSNDPTASLEKFFDGVRRAFAGPGIEALPVTGSDIGTERAASRTGVGNHYQFPSCLRPYSLAKSSIRCQKSTRKAFALLSAVNRRTTSSTKNTTLSIAACARKHGASGRFSYSRQAIEMTCGSNAA